MTPGRVISAVSKGLGGVASAAALLIMFVIVVDVLGRWLFKFSFLGANEGTGLLMAVTIWFSVALVQRRKGHLRMDLVTVRLSKRMQLFLDLFASVLGIAAFAGMMWFSIDGALQATAIRQTSPGASWLPVYPIKWVMVVGLLLLTLEFLASLAETAQKLLEGTKADG